MQGSQYYGENIVLATDLKESEKKMSKIKKASFFLNHLEEILLVTFLATTVVLVFLQVCMRYIFNNSLSWTEELARYLFVWESWLGISIGAKHGKHLRIELLTNKLKGRALTSVLTLADIVTLLILGVLIYYGADLTNKMFAMNINSASLRIPMGFIYMALPVGCSCMVIRTLSDIYHRYRSKKQEVLN